MEILMLFMFTTDFFTHHCAIYIITYCNCTGDKISQACS